MVELVTSLNSSTRMPKVRLPCVSCVILYVELSLTGCIDRARHACSRIAILWKLDSMHRRDVHLKKSMFSPPLHVFCSRMKTINQKGPKVGHSPTNGDAVSRLSAKIETRPRLHLGSRLFILLYLLTSSERKLTDTLYTAAT